VKPHAVMPHETIAARVSAIVVGIVGVLQSQELRL